MHKKLTALITGATSGIGLACARRFAAGGWNLVLVARRAERLEAISKQIADHHGVKIMTIQLDVRDKETIKVVEAFLNEQKCNIDVLVNNAGLAAGLNPIHEGLVDDWERMIDTNIKGLLYVTKAVLPGMIVAAKGHIINIGSIAGKEVYPGGNVYSATKFAVEGLTRSMRIDLLPYGIKVTQVAPGAAETEFSLVRFNGDSERAKHVYQGYKPLRGKDVAEAVWFAANLPSHVNVNDLLLMPSAQAGSVHFHRSVNKL